MCVLALAAARPAAAQLSTADLAGATLEELLNIRVTSASRKEQLLEDVPAAVFVITQEDIRRSGLTTVPELLRLVPGMQVARINGSKWAVSARGFNDLYANKLLVLVDGRSIYNRLYSGVYWAAADLLVADIDRIEVIRGPGGAVWGANAVNGVINIVTRSAAETQGALVDVGTGTSDRGRIAARYGGSRGRLSYRVFSQWSDYADNHLDDGASADDGWHSLIGGARFDWTGAADTVMWQAQVFDSVERPNYFKPSSLMPGAPFVITDPSDNNGVTVLGRWTRSLPRAAKVTVQGFSSHAYHDEDGLRTVERTNDGEAQYQRRVGGRHELVAGGGFRQASLETRSSFLIAVDSGHTTVFNAFAQDEFTVGPVTVTLGSKVERDAQAGWGLLPSARALWHLTPTHHLWAAVSRARRTPSAAERTLRVNAGTLPGEPLPLMPGIVGNPTLQSERVVLSEVGYRVRAGARMDIDITGFRGSYDDLTWLVPLPPVVEATPAPAHVFMPMQIVNGTRAHTAGLELSARWAPIDAWRLDGSYSFLHLHPQPPANPEGGVPPPFDGNAPRHQWQVRSTVWLGPRLQVNAAAYYVGELRALGVPDYTRVDTGAEFALGSQVSVALVGQNLLHARHQEFSGRDLHLQHSMIPRSARLQLRWRF